MNDADEIEVWAESIRALAPFAARIREPAFQFGSWHDQDANADGSISMPWFDFSDDAQAIIAAAAGWILPGFDWPAWQHTAEAERLLSDPAALAEASPKQIARILTLLIRQDRFVEGELARVYESGLLRRALERVAVFEALGRR